ncbi:Acyl-CoA synthetase (AMP-forming)/AMP-acid ligase II, partial [Geosmithia morbida]
PLALAVPAAAASLAYINAKGSIFNDVRILNTIITSFARVAYRQHVDRLNQFYTLEDLAQSPSHTNKPLVIFEGKRHTYSDVYNRVLRYASWLRNKHSVSPGEIVAIDFHNSDTFIYLWFALWAVGAKPAFINYNLTGDALAHCVRAATARLVIVDPAVTDVVDEDIRSQLPDVNFVTLDGALEDHIASLAPTRPPDKDRSQAQPSEMALLIYTSGTTGIPKPAIVSWSKCMAGSVMGQKMLGIKSDDTIFTSMPLYHSAAAIMSFMCVLNIGGTQGLGRKFSTRTFWEEVRATDATVIQYVGETLRYLLAAPVQPDPETGESLDKKHRVRLAYGNGLRPDVWDRFRDRFGIPIVGELYAATEGTMGMVNLCSNQLTSGAIGRSGWIHRLMLRRSAALVDVDWEADQPRRDPETGFCSRVSRGEPGELLFALPAADTSKRFQGYYQNPEASAEKILRDVFSQGDAWFRTGDVVRFTTDGLWFFHDRIGDTFRWKSENVSTTEVSQAIGTHPAIREANVYGVELPNHDGRAGCAAIHVGKDADDDTMRSIAQHALSNLPRYAVPLFLRVLRGTDLGSAQTTGTNKQQKSLLRTAGVRPEPGTDKELGELYWLPSDAGYVPFMKRDWDRLEGGSVRL